MLNKTRQSWVALIALVAVIGCGKAGKLLETAKTMHNAGSPGRAAGLLQQLKTEEPTAPEVSEANTLAPAWLVEQFDGTPPDERATSGKSLLDKALVWDPKNGPAQVRLCQLLADAKDFAGLRTCVEHDLSEKEGVPGDKRKALQSILDTNERQRLLDSGAAADLQTVVSKFASSPEAAAAQERLREAQSICANLMGPWEITSRIKEIQETVSKKIQETMDIQMGNDLLKQMGLGQLADAREKVTKDIEAVRDAIKAHPALPGEEPIRATLLEDYARVIAMNNRWSKALRAVAGKVVNDNVVPGAPLSTLAGSAAQVTEANVRDVNVVTKNDVSRTQQCSSVK